MNKSTTIVGAFSNKGSNVFRETFQHSTKDVTHYFPGHMAKGLKQIRRKLQKVDCIVEVHDARVPISGRNPRFQETLNLVRPHLYVLNKMDIADADTNEAVRSTLMQDHGVKDVLFVSCKRGSSIKHKLLDAVMKIIEPSSRFHRTEASDYNVLIIGIPNVGKSSIINALRQTHLGKAGKATRVGALPGITRSVLEKIKISESPKVYVYDTPGIMLPHIPDMDVGMKLAMCATLKDHLVGIVTIADYMLFWLNTHAQFQYVQFYGLSEPVDDIHYFLTHIAKQRSLVLKLRSPNGGHVFRPNFNHAAEIVLHDFRAGRLGQFNLDIDLLRNDCVSNTVRNSAVDVEAA